MFEIRRTQISDGDQAGKERMDSLPGRGTLAKTLRIEGIRVPQSLCLRQETRLRRRKNR